MRIGAPDRLAPGKGAHQNQQGGFWQVEVGEQPVHHPEAVARRDEQVRLAHAGLAATGFQRPHGRRADGHHRPSPGLRPRNGLRRLGRNGIALGMHLVLRQVFGTHRQEGAGPHVQRQVGHLHTPRAQSRQ